MVFFFLASSFHPSVLVALRWHCCTCESRWCWNNWYSQLCVVLFFEDVPFIIDLISILIDNVHLLLFREKPVMECRTRYIRVILVHMVTSHGIHRKGGSSKSSIATFNWILGNDVTQVPYQVGTRQSDNKSLISNFCWFGFIIDWITKWSQLSNYLG